MLKIILSLASGIVRNHAPLAGCTDKPRPSAVVESGAGRGGFAALPAENRCLIGIAVRGLQDFRHQLVREPRWVGFDAPREFLIGYGLDHSENFRNLPYIGSLKAPE